MVHEVGHKIGAGRKEDTTKKASKQTQFIESIDDASLGNIGFSDAETVHDMQSYEPGSFDHPDKGQHLLGPSYDNPLHKFASYNTLFTLSGLHKDELDDLSYLKTPPHDIIARSSGIGDNPNVSTDSFHKRQATMAKFEKEETLKKWGLEKNANYNQEPSFNILSAGHDIFFEDVNILSTVGPNPERGLANFTKMEFQLHEPYGVTLVEKIRAACYVNYFVDYQDAPLLLTIQWKGWDEHGKDMSILGGSQALTRKIPILISRVSFEVDEGGARYQCIAVPYGDLAFDDRFKFPRTIVNFSASTMDVPVKEYKGGVLKSIRGGWIGKMEAALHKQMEDEKEENVRELNDTYRFIVHKDVSEYGDTWLKDLHTNHYEDHESVLKKIGQFFGTNDGVPEVKIDFASGTIDMGTALPKFFEDAIRTLHGYQQLAERFWYTYGSTRLKEAGEENHQDMDKVLKYFRSSFFAEDLQKHQYVNWFMIKPAVHTDTDRFDRIRKVHPKTITYYAMPTKIHILKFVKPGISFGNVKWDRYVKKQYDYIYTGNNIDVLGLKIDYKSAYYMRNVRPYWKTAVAKGKYEKFVADFNETINKVHGQEQYPEKLLPLRQEPSHIKGKSTISTTAPTTNKSQEFYDYLTNPQADMMKIELEILGDPQYICQDVFTTLRKDSTNTNYLGGLVGIYDKKWGSFNAEQYQPLVKVNYRLPDEIDVKKEGLMFEKQVSSRENLFFNGVYQVTKVESRVNQGQFTQVLTLVRLNNQKGEGEGAFEAGSDGTIQEYFANKKILKQKASKSMVAYSSSELNAVLFDKDAFNKARDAKIKAEKLKDSLIK